MLALQKNQPFQGTIDDLERTLKFHKQRIENANKNKSNIDTSSPRPSSRLRYRHQNLPFYPIELEIKSKVVKDNFILAQKLYKIIETPSDVAKYVQHYSEYDDIRPKTSNFKNRITEAKQVYHENLHIASRLESVKSTYSRYAQTLPKLKKKFRGNAIDAILLRKMMNTRSKNQSNELDQPTIHDECYHYHHHHHSSSSSSSSSNHVDLDFNDGKDVNKVQESADADGNHNHNHPHPVVAVVLFQCSKVIEHGRILDSAVIFNSVQNQYRMYGVDIESGQKYESIISSNDIDSFFRQQEQQLKLSLQPPSQQEGCDNNQEHWMRLVDQVVLRPVHDFSHTYYDVLRNETIHSNQSNEAHINPRKPIKPNSQSRPKSSYKTGGRVGKHLIVQSQNHNNYNPLSVVVEDKYMMALENEALEVERLFDQDSRDKISSTESINPESSLIE